MVIGECSLPVLVLILEPFIIFPLSCPVEEGESDRAVLVGMWHLSRPNKNRKAAASLSATAKLTHCSRSRRSNKAWFPQNLVSNLLLLSGLDKICQHCGKPKAIDALVGRAGNVKQDT